MKYTPAPWTTKRTDEDSVKVLGIDGVQQIMIARVFESESDESNLRLIAAVCAVLACAIWDYHRPDYEKDEHPGNSMRKMFVRILGRGLAKRWFD